MNVQRASEIAASPIMANVTLDGTPVYIQHVDEAEEVARVYPLDRPDQEMNVAVRQLVEDGEEVGSVGPILCRDI
ncbi:H-type small acid-soluble spore protein [Cohnella thailandensis]|uniref:H-type small acid-soluble spore protein n=1 Tax=Cohnella thailandensis TaxID=557557 RepID=A0A841STH0_9BACL|nr:H-type small acid-soluble spore protein [Cohnella thailandensis]MBB6633508.1 H-type small acid-soluble spore protein [Cohnella thailandensis]MBP1974525.1 small acid-soluble spore protein H (minor) [Cohnella thailandensis]